MEQVSQINVSLKGRISELEHQVTRFQAEQKVQEVKLVPKKVHIPAQAPQREIRLRGKEEEEAV